MIINNSNFKLDEIPKFHPISQQYDRLQFWKEQKRRCIEGYWSSGKWMPPELYYYVNFHNIVFEEGIYRSVGLPWLRDIDWEKAYIYAEATGFSGFEKDDEYSCNRLLITPGVTDYDFSRLYKDYSGKVIPEYKSNFYKKDGTLKTYVPAREYLRKIHKGNLGKAIFLNQSQHVIEVASRGYGKSVGASGQIAHNFLFDGARDYDIYLKRRDDGNPLQSETVVGAIDAKYSTKLVDKVKLAIERLPGKEIITIGGEKVEFPSPLTIGYTGSFAVGKQGITTDVSKTILQHVTFNDNPLAANGGRPNRIFIDEVGFMSNILEVWEAIESTQASADFKRLTIYGMGTGGLTSGGAVAYIQEMFYNPESYGCLTFDDEWESRGKIAYFVPGTMALNKFKEGPNLITNEKRALNYIENERKLAEKSRSQTKILGTIINKPIKPSEIFLRMDGNFFQTSELKDHLANLESKKTLLDSSWKVDMKMEKEGIVEAVPSIKRPIRDFPLTRNTELDACVEIFERPKKNNNGVVPFGRYVMVVDPVDDDVNDNFKRSLQSTHVFDTWTDRFVAEYTARTYLAEDYYEVVRRLSIYYNANILYENNKKGLYTYFKNKNYLYKLLPTPEILKEQFSTKIENIDTNKGLGVNMSNVRLKLHAVRLLKSYLEKGSYDDKDVKNLYTIRSVAFLKELISFSMDINADRVSSALVLMILLSDIGDKTVRQKDESVKTASKSNFWHNAYRTNNKVYNPMNFIPKDMIENS